MIACTVYKSLKKNQTYVFVPQSSDTADLPEALNGLLGTLEKVLDVEINENSTLARAKPCDVIQNIQQHGFYLQMPPGKEQASIDPFTETGSPDWLQ